MENKEKVKISVKDFIRRYMSYIPVFIFSLIVTTAIAYVYLRYATPLYNARGTLLIKKENSKPSRADREFESMLMYSGSSTVDNEIEILKSISLAKRVAKALNLQCKYYAVGKIKTSIAYPFSPLTLVPVVVRDSNIAYGFKINILNEKQFSFQENPKIFSFGESFTKDGSTFKLLLSSQTYNSLKYKEYNIVYESLESAALGIAASIKVNPVKDRSDVLMVSSITKEPKLAVDIVNQLMEEYKNLSIEDKNQIATKTIDFITERVKIIARELGDVEKNIQQFKQKNQVINIEAQSDIYLKDISEFEKRITESEVKRGIVVHLNNYISNKDNNLTIIPSLGIDDPVLTVLIKDHNDLQLLRDRELKTTTISNPTIQLIDNQINKSREGIKDALKNSIITNTMAIDDLKRKNSTVKSSVSTIPTKERELLEIARQQGIKQNLYLYLLQKREETAISLASTIPNSQVIDRAMANYAPIKPNSTSVKGLAFFLGLLLPILFIYIRELLNDKVTSRNDVQNMTKAPIIGEIGHSENDKVLVVSKSSRGVVAEQFRIIRSNLQYIIGYVEKPVILITSTFSGEGKSFASINVAAAMALAGKKTLLLEFDIRKPKIIDGLNLKRSAGITNFIVGNSRLEDIILPVKELDNLFILPCGAIPPNPSEILLEEKVSEIFAYAKRMFDVVIIDTAPIGLVSDAVSLSKFANCTLYLVRIKHTLKKQVQFIEDVYSNNKLPKVGILVNDIKADSHYYGYGNYSAYGYGYGYGYGQGYYENDKKNGSQNRIILFFKKIFKAFKF